MDHFDFFRLHDPVKMRYATFRRFGLGITLLCMIITPVAAQKNYETRAVNAAMATASKKQEISRALSRRRFLPVVSGVAGGLLINPQESHGNDAKLTNAPPPPVAGGRGPVIPGLSAPLRPVVVEDDQGWRVPKLTTELGRSRIGVLELSPLNPSLNPLADNEIYYPPFLFGAWDVTATFKRKVYPFGTEFVPSRSLVEGSPRNRQESVGDSTQFEAHYYSSSSNGIITDLSKSKIINDRAYNAMSTSRAYKQLTPVQEVEWDPRNDPTRLTLLFGAGPLTEDMMPLGQRKAEVYINARRSESGFNNEEGAETFCATERTRQVTVSPGNVVVSDTESITEFQIAKTASDMKAGDVLKATSRIAVFLTPNPNSREGVLWEQVRGKAVAFFDYDIVMRKKYENNSGGNREARVCVQIPKGVVQCA